MFDEAQLLDDGLSYTFHAMQAYRSEDADLFGLHAGVAAERMAKACLARRSPALLVELQSNAFNSLAMLLGIAVVEPLRRRTKIRTVGLQIAFQRLQALGVQIDVSKESLENFIEARNWSTHDGNGGFDLEDTAADFVKVVDSLLVDLKYDRYSFWHVHLADADRLKNGAEQRHRERVLRLLAEAAERFASLVHWSGQLCKPQPLFTFSWSPHTFGSTAPRAETLVCFRVSTAVLNPHPRLKLVSSGCC